jgi:hypothetical protein
VCEKHLVRLLTFALAVSSFASLAKPPMMIEIKNLPGSPHAALAMLPKEKPGPFRRQLVTLVEAKLREKGTPFTDADAIDTMVTGTFAKIFEDLAAPTDVWAWTGDEKDPRGDVLIRKTVKLMPGVTTTTFGKSFTVSPRGKRVDRAFLNTPCTVDVSVAKSEQDFFSEVESRGNWVALVHPVATFDKVARVAIQFLSPAKGENGAARHERPLWVAYFTLDTKDPQLALFEPYLATEQKLQESNVLPADPKEKLVDSQKQLVLAMHLMDLRLINPSRKSLTPAELKYVQLEGITESPVDARHVAWLEPWRTDENALTRAVAVLRIAQLGGTVTVPEVVFILEHVRAVQVQAEAFGLLGKLLDASTQVVSETDKAQLSKHGADDIKAQGDVAKVRLGGRVTFYRQGKTGWVLLVPAS